LVEQSESQNESLNTSKQLISGFKGIFRRVFMEEQITAKTPQKTPSLEH